MDRRHVRRHARLPDQRGLPGTGGQAYRRAGGQTDRHPGRIPLLLDGRHVVHAAHLRHQPLDRHRRRTGLRTLDLLPADHRRGPHHQDVGAGLRPADDGRRMDDPARQPLVRRRTDGAGHLARNRRQPSADYLLFPRGDGRAVDQRGDFRPARKADARLRPAYRGTGRSGHSGRRIELRAAVVHGPAHEGDHPRRLGAGRNGLPVGECPGRARPRLRHGVELRPHGDLQPAHPRLHGAPVGHDLPGRRRDGCRAERLRVARSSTTTPDLLGHAALHGRPDLSGRRGDLPRRAGAHPAARP